MANKNDIWIFIPAYNEGSIIGEVITNIRELGYSNIVLINDGSTDNTREEAENAGAIVLNHLFNRGAGAATQTGIDYARARQISPVVFLDGDGQHFADNINCLHEAYLESGADLIIGSRFMQKNDNIPFSRRFFNKIANILTRIIGKSHYSDSQSGFRLLGKNAIQEMQMHIDGFGYCSEMIVQAERRNFKVLEIPINVSYTEYSKSKGQDLHMGVKTAMELFWRILLK